MRSDSQRINLSRVLEVRTLLSTDYACRLELGKPRYASSTRNSTRTVQCVTRTISNYY